MQTRSHEVPAEVRGIEEALARAEAEIPALGRLLGAFGPLLMERARLRDQAPGWTGPMPPVDPERFTQGVYLLADADFQDMSADLPRAASALLPVLARSFPALAPELSALAAALETGALSPQDLALAGFGQPVSLAGISGQTLHFVAAELVRPFVERQAQDLSAQVRDLSWRQTACPVCGGVPNMSVLRRIRDESEYIQAHGGRRFLRCSCCSTEWTHKRVSCPGCGCEEPEDLVVLRHPARPHERADACNRCKTFLLCLDAGELAEAPDPDVAAMAMSPLEAKAREQGFAPLAAHPWSGLLGGK